MSIMKRNVQLVEATAYTDDYEDWFLKLVYTYDDDKGKHQVTFPKVDLPFNQYSTLAIKKEANLLIWPMPINMEIIMLCAMFVKKS